MKKVLLLTALFVLLMIPSKNNFAQMEGLKVNFNGYFDAYFVTDNDNVPQNQGMDFNRQLAFSNHYKNTFGLNTAQLGAKITYKDIARSTITLHTGHFQEITTPTDSKTPYLQQANMGIQFAKDFWIDAGYFFTHIGGESALLKDNWLSSYSMVTYYEPFYQSGIKVSYEGEKFLACVHLLNGNGILEDNNYNKSLGWQFGYKFSDAFNISYAGILGNEEPGSPNNAKTHHLHNIVAQVNVTPEFSLKGQFDLALKSDIRDPENFTKTINGTFMGAGLTAHYDFIKQLGGTFRFAYINDKDGVYNTYLQNGLDLTLGAEYKPYEKSYIRLEGRMLQFDSDKNKIFTDADGKKTNSRMEVSLNFGFWFD